MTILHCVMKEALVESGRLEPSCLGGHKISSWKKEQHEKLLERLRIEVNGFNKRLIVVLACMYILLFIFLLIILCLHLKSSSIIYGALGGTGIFILASVKGLQRLWREKTVFDILLIALPDLMPEVSIKLIENLYYSNKIMKHQSRPVDH